MKGKYSKKTQIKSARGLILALKKGASIDRRTRVGKAVQDVKRAVRESKVRKSRGALFVAIVRRACADRGVVVKESPVGVKQRLHW